jgi:ATP-dependent RNA helicase RhlE
VERRILQDFEYKKPKPARDNEFARPPREPQRRREVKKPEPSTTAVPQKRRQVQPAIAAAHRNSVPKRSSGSTTRKFRTYKPGKGR